MLPAPTLASDELDVVAESAGSHDFPLGVASLDLVNPRLPSFLLGLRVPT